MKLEIPISLIGLILIRTWFIIQTEFVLFLWYISTQLSSVIRIIYLTDDHLMMGPIFIHTEYLMLIISI